MNILALFYTNNNISPAVLNHSLTSIQKMVDYTNIKQHHTVKLAISSYSPIKHPVIMEAAHYPCFYRNQGHLNIALQVLGVLLGHEEFDYVAFLEHDVLYAPNYMDSIITYVQAARVVEENRIAQPIICNQNYIGMNTDGYQKSLPQIALSQMAMPVDTAVSNFERAIRHCAKQGWCYLEPQHNSRFVYIQPDFDKTPNVHINMNRTDQPHHFTNHYDTYEPEAYTKEHPLWGHYQDYQIFQAPVIAMTDAGS